MNNSSNESQIRKIRVTEYLTDLLSSRFPCMHQIRSQEKHFLLRITLNIRAVTQSALCHTFAKNQRGILNINMKHEVEAGGREDD